MAPRSAATRAVALLLALASPAASDEASFCSRGAAHNLALLQAARTGVTIMQGPPAPAPVPVSVYLVPLSTFFWNVHWECSLAANGASSACKETVGRKFVELARTTGASIVASIELSDTTSNPASFEYFGLAGWTQVNGPCVADGGFGDSAALGFAPGWQVERSSGGCLRADADTRAMAVARVTPPAEATVAGCPSLCVVAIHAPHSAITQGKGLVHEVCAEAADRCTVAMGDWNTPAQGVGQLWDMLVGGATPSLAVPDERTCCFPEDDHYGVFDHIATNIEGAQEQAHVVHPYQNLEENPVKQHRPVAVHLLLPVLS